MRLSSSVSLNSDSISSAGVDRTRARLDNEPHVLGGLIAHVGDERQLSLVDQLGDFLHQPRLLHQPGNFGDDDRVGAAPGLLLVPARAHAERAAPGRIGFGDRFPAVDDEPAGGKIRAGDELQQRAASRLGIVDQMQRGVAQLGRVVRRDRGRHADRNSLRAVGQQIGETRPAVPPAPATGRRSWRGNRPHPRRCRRAAAGRPRSCALRCNDRRLRYRRRYCRNCPGRRSADNARKNPARAAPARRKSPGRHADGNCPSRRRRSWRTSSASRRDRGGAAACHRGCAGVPASIRRARPAERGA